MAGNEIELRQGGPQVGIRSGAGSITSEKTSYQSVYASRGKCEGKRNVYGVELKSK